METVKNFAGGIMAIGVAVIWTTLAAILADVIH